MKNYTNFINEHFLKSDARGYKIGQYVYHITPKRKMDEIYDNGLKPQSGKSINGKYFENRLYFATSLIAAYDLSVNFSSYKDSDEYVIIELDSSCIGDYETDDLFSHGIYVDYPVSPEYILGVQDADYYFNKFDDDDIEKLYESS